MTMQREHIDHPSEEALERFLLHRMEEGELESFETHILACEKCVTRLEELEIYIAATKKALQDLHYQNVAENVAKESKRSSGWFGLRALSLAGAATALAVALAVVPKFTPYEKDMSAFRGVETSFVPANRPGTVHLNAKDLTPGAVSLELVDADGNQIWKGSGVISNSKVDAHLPRLSSKSNYLIRIYQQDKDSSEANLVREFSFQAE